MKKFLTVNLTALFTKNKYIGIDMKNKKISKKEKRKNENHCFTQPRLIGNFKDELIKIDGV